jgi:hypothetical protein
MMRRKEKKRWRKIINKNSLEEEFVAPTFSEKAMKNLRRPFTWRWKQTV